jgi:ribosomal protein S18 acetylase RimI-like enzyme
VSDSTVALSRLCEESARRQAGLSREVSRHGPFEALINLHDDMIWLNYAVPVAPVDGPDAAETIAALTDHFAARGRRLRFEFHAAPWPSLPGLLESAGLSLQARHPLMVCAPGDLRPLSAPGVTVQRLAGDAPDADLDAFTRIQAAGFGEGVGEIRAERRARMRESIGAGATFYGLARLDGAPAGAAVIAPFDDVGELAGVATHPDFRRRGVAATLSAALTADFLAGGGALAWLSAGDAVAQAVYAKIGFRLVDERLNYIL